METQHINYIRCVADKKNISAAARELDMTQPALTKIILRVEDLVGAKLFDRRSRGVELTPIGRLYVEKMSSVEAEIKSLNAEVLRRKAGLSGTVNLAVGQLWLGSLLPLVVAKLARVSPGIQVRIMSGPRDALLEQLRNGRADLMLGRVTEAMPEECLGQELAKVNISLVARAGHPLGNLGRSVTPEEVADYGWVLPPCTDPTMKYAFDNNGLEAPVAKVETVSRQFINGLLRESDCVTILAGVAGKPLPPDQIRLKADWLGWSADAGVIWVRNRTLLPCCDRFLRILRAEMSQVTSQPEMVGE